MNWRRRRRRGRRESLRLGVGAAVCRLRHAVFEPDRRSQVVRTGVMLVVAAMIGGYMAMNIGANDVANNVGPAVGSRAISMTGAIIIAATFEMAGALIAGGDVVATVQKGHHQSGDDRRRQSIHLGHDRGPAGRRHLAECRDGVRRPSVDDALDHRRGTRRRYRVGRHASGQLGNVDRNRCQLDYLAGHGRDRCCGMPVLDQAFNHLSGRYGCRRQTGWCRSLIGLMAFSFATYLILKGFNKIWNVDVLPAFGIGIGVGLVTYWFVGRSIAGKFDSLENSKASINTLFTIPLICAAALLSFAHGANDVANAVGPLAAIADAAKNTAGAISAKASIPLWVIARRRKRHRHRLVALWPETHPDSG